MYVYMLAIFLLSPFLSPILSFFSFITFSCTVFFHLLFPFFSLLLLYRFSSFHVFFPAIFFLPLLNLVSLPPYLLPFLPPPSTVVFFLLLFPCVFSFNLLPLALYLFFLSQFAYPLFHIVVFRSFIFSTF